MTEKKNKSAIQRRLIPTYIFLIIVSFISVFPLYWMISAATNTSTDVSRGRILPGTYFMQNFKNLTAQQPLWRALGNSLFYAVLTTVICLLICSIAGYGFEVYHDRWKDRLFSTLLLAMMVPQVATMVPLFKMFSKAGLLNTAVGFILPIISTPFMIMMFRQNARAFPIDIIEAARIDGLSEVLGLGLDESIILIGIGNLGSAILKYNRWQYTVGKIVCGYDQDKNKEGERFGVKLYNIDDLEKTFPKDCKIAILAISENVQPTVDRLMDLGIKGIVDFTHTHFTVREGVEVQQVDVVVAIQELVIKMDSNRQ